MPEEGRFSLRDRGENDVPIVRYTQVRVRKLNRTIWQLVSLRVAEDEQLYQVRRTDLFLNFNWVRCSGYFGEPLMQAITPHVPITVSKTVDEE